MKTQTKSNSMRGLLSLFGAALFLAPLTVIAQAPTGPDLKVTKTCAVNGPQSVLCTVTIKNIGQVPSVAPLSLTDLPTAPAGSTYTGAGSNTGLAISCSPGAGPVIPISCNANKSLQPNETADAIFSFKLPVTMCGTFKNTVTVTQASNAATLPDPNPANNTNISTTLNLGTCGKPIVIVTPPPSGVCLSNVVVSGLHYPTQTCAQSTPNFLSTLMTSFHFKSKCAAPNQLLGVTNASCQNAPIPGFPTGSVYQATVCCGIVAPATATLKIVKKVSQPPSTQAFNFTMAGPGLTGATLDDDGTNGNPLSNAKTFGNVGAGVPLTVTEDAVSGWTVSSIVCLPASGTTVNLATRTLTANLTPGANVTCTFNNQPVTKGCPPPAQTTIGCRATVTIKRTKGPAIYSVLVSPTAPFPNTTPPSNATSCTINGGNQIPQTTCWFNYSANSTPVTLTATSSLGSLPPGFFWTGACSSSGSNPTCLLNVTLANPPIVTANFP